ncbi:hypothetical protein ACXGQW_07665 [Wenyingzhuangia sp. IMCC45533]
MKKIYILIAVILFSSIDDANAQRRRRRTRRSNSNVRIQHEVGGNVGISNFQGDFSGDGPADGQILVNGFTINATHSAHLVPARRTRNNGGFAKHLVLKTNLGYTKGSYDNLGISTGNERLDKNGDPSQVDSDVLLGRLSSEASIITLGTQLEFYFKDMITYLHRSSRRRYSRRGRSGGRGNVYLGVGFGVNYVSSDAEYSLAGTNVGNNNGLPDNYDASVIGGIDEAVFSGNFAVGYRYKLNPTMDLVGEIKFNQYFSDRIDAVEPVVGNDTNDYNTNITVGVIYHLF